MTDYLKLERELAQSNALAHTAPRYKAEDIGRIVLDSWPDAMRALRLAAVVEEAEKALDRLARLGNEPEFGNSDGNMIARAALARIKEAREG